ncbi:hypothetical protein GLYMA_08G356400v4 [Glycine max]|uniref:Uncharacterized protein n=1 Tax=Glycine max TaxID=3847 RepID=K7LAT6_SOYBN|nr:hypothetical protein GYH30_023452 [Glycine max]KRH46788.1 hypothetical protein GLYMA_08G356400v4 [Glycine max]
MINFLLGLASRSSRLIVTKAKCHYIESYYVLVSHVQTLVNIQSVVSADKIDRHSPFLIELVLVQCYGMTPF